MAIKINPHDGAEMIWISGGEFLMGSDDGCNNEMPLHRVYLDAYWMYRTPVTVKQYQSFCSATGRPMPEPPSWGWKDDHPMVNVTWEDILA